jgi:hypothetical protein
MNDSDGLEEQINDIDADSIEMQELFKLVRTTNEKKLGPYLDEVIRLAAGRRAFMLGVGFCDADVSVMFKFIFERGVYLLDGFQEASGEEEDEE